jgi:hypothetical protein
VGTQWISDDSPLRGALPFWFQLSGEPEDKRELVYVYDGSDERSVSFPVPFTASSLRRLARRIDPPSQAGCALFRARGGFPWLRNDWITPVARMDAVTSFQKWFQ